MKTCPLCGEPSSDLHIQIEQLTVNLIAREHPGWQLPDGSCPPCLEYYRSLDIAFGAEDPDSGSDSELEIEPSEASLRG